MTETKVVRQRVGKLILKFSFDFCLLYFSLVRFLFSFLLRLCFCHKLGEETSNVERVYLAFGGRKREKVEMRKEEGD